MVAIEVSFGWIRDCTIPASSISQRLALTNKGVEGQAASGHPKTRQWPAYHFGYATVPYSSSTLVGRLNIVRVAKGSNAYGSYENRAYYHAIPRGLLRAAILRSAPIDLRLFPIPLTNKRRI